jgi:hypothetical protein
MPQESASLIACRMDALSPQQRSRRSEILDLIRPRVYRVSETTDGVQFEWRGGDDLPALIGEFVVLESRCCPFIRFTMDVEAERGPILLRLGGREGVKDFLRSTFLA